ncbi:uncharacterized protein BXZ73DRAFT_102053 [Epithele typhae]|uniref:uncharacterized protein n=1 Tax=Epithele typhae TaxID=378194 RepID=UPI0020085350|nr:uncharacterized protein BXZ73DRAFT_102053 [Epithele typhae]KAH9929523.1 hypothetical protein BXZ73DRAFT_102053 [Epithele typhae]
MSGPAPLYLVQGNPMQTMALRLNPDHGPSDSIPHELQKYYSPDVWVARQRAVMTKGGRYLKPRFDIAFAVFMFIGALALPIAIYYVALHALPNKEKVFQEANGRVLVEDDRFWEARAISGASLIGFLLLGWGPFFFWKAQGKRQVNQMLQRFRAEDAAMAGPNATIPEWTMNMPSMGSKALHVMITYPRPPMMTAFQVGVQLPPYIVNQPVDPNGARYYQQYAPPAGAPPGRRTSTGSAGSIPLYGSHNEKIPDYSGPTSNAYMPRDEKDGFDDIRV